MSELTIYLDDRDELGEAGPLVYLVDSDRDEVQEFARASYVGPRYHLPDAAQPLMTPEQAIDYVVGLIEDVVMPDYVRVKLADVLAVDRVGRRKS